jgi:hypothetical protein
MKSACIILGVLLSGTAVDAQLRSGLLESLVRDSPFRPPAGGAAPAEGGAAQFEFRGVVVEAGGYSFSVYDQSRHEAGWVKLDEPGRTFVARRFDPTRDTLTIEQNGQSLTLALKRARVQAMAVTPPVAPPPPLPTSGALAPGPAVGNAPPSGPNALNAQEAQRLQNIADEIRRRRGLRQLPPADKPPGSP